MSIHRPVLAATLAVAFAGALAVRAEPELIDGIAAQVDDRVVLISEVMAATRGQEQALRAAGAKDSDILRLRASALERLIEDRLLARIVANNEMEADEAEVNRTIGLIAQENGLSVEQLYASVVFHGLTVEAYRAQIKGDIERRNLIQAAVGVKAEVEEDEVVALYRERYDDQPESGESVRVRQILRAAGGPTKRRPATACAEARAARERVLAGEDFASVAAEVSEVAPENGGDIGWLPLASVAPWMKQAVEGLEPGDVSELLELRFGCSVLQLVERRNLEPVTFESARLELEAELRETKMQEEYRSWMETLREQSYIERRGYFANNTRLRLPEDLGETLGDSEPAAP